MATTASPSTPADAMMPTTTNDDMPTAMVVTSVEELDSAEKKKSGPGGKHDTMRTYSPEEAALVFELVEAHAPRWTHIAKLVSEKMNQPRTAASVRNYYKRFCQSKKIAERDSAIRKLNRCQQCGMIKRGHVCKGAQNVEFAAPTKGLATATAAEANASAPAARAPAAAPVEAPPAAAPVTRVVTPPPMVPVVGGLVLSKDSKALPPLAPAALEVLMPGGAFGVSPGALSTPGPLSLSAFSLLGSPTALAALGLPTPASMPASAMASAVAAACFPFARAVTGDDEIMPGAEDETTDAEGEVAHILASQDIGALPMAAAAVSV